RRHVGDPLSRPPPPSEPAVASLVYHHGSPLSPRTDARARRGLLRWGVVLRTGSHVVWQLRVGATRSDPLAQGRDRC
ncbi:FUSC family protein, partial [Klebsiella pneumoniae]|nr:FUSC family protein [Klebsiella pneumoniae]